MVKGLRQLCRIEDLKRRNAVNSQGSRSFVQPPVSTGPVTEAAAPSMICVAAFRSLCSMAFKLPSCTAQHGSTGQASRLGDFPGHAQKHRHRSESSGKTKSRGRGICSGRTRKNLSVFDVGGSGRMHNGSEMVRSGCKRAS